MMTAEKGGLVSSNITPSSSSSTTKVQVLGEMNKQMVNSVVNAMTKKSKKKNKKKKGKQGKKQKDLVVVEDDPALASSASSPMSVRSNNSHLSDESGEAVLPKHQGKENGQAEEEEPTPTSCDTKEEEKGMKVKRVSFAEDNNKQEEKQPNNEETVVVSASSSEAKEEEEEQQEQQQQLQQDEMKTPDVLCQEFMMSADILGRDKPLLQGWLNVMPVVASKMESSSSWKWKKSWVLLHNNVLYIFPSFDSNRPYSIVILDQVKMDRKCEMSQAYSDQDIPRMFKMTSRTGRVLYFQAESEVKAQKWMRLIATQGYEQKLRRAKKLEQQKRNYDQQQLVNKSSITKESGTVLLGLLIIFQVLVQMGFEAGRFLYAVKKQETSK